MRLSTKGRYAVMAMVDLARHGADGPVALADIALRQEISLPYLEQLFAKLRRAYRILLHANTSRAIAQIETDPTLQCAEVQYVVNFIKSSTRGVGLRRPSRRLEEAED